MRVPTFRSWSTTIGVVIQQFEDCHYRPLYHPPRLKIPDQASCDSKLGGNAQAGLICLLMAAAAPLIDEESTVPSNVTKKQLYVAIGLDYL
jgi:hypothetical protein